MVAVEQAFGVPVYFVLGNHDFYGLSGLDAAVEWRKVNQPSQPGVVWLRDAPPVELCPGVVLTGHEGWYDARCGDPMGTDVMLRDFFEIGDFRSFMGLRPTRFVDRVGLVEACRAVADRWAEEARGKLAAALAQSPTRVLFATHVPPFARACWHKGAVSDVNWLPWFTNVALGAVLADVATANPKVRFDVYCGHTHSPGIYTHLPNLVVYTGRSEYRTATVSKVILT